MDQCRNTFNGEMLSLPHSESQRQQISKYHYIENFGIFHFKKCPLPVSVLICLRNSGIILQDCENLSLLVAPVSAGKKIGKLSHLDWSQHSHYLFCLRAKRRWIVQILSFRSTNTCTTAGTHEITSMKHDCLKASGIPKVSSCNAVGANCLVEIQI